MRDSLRLISIYKMIKKCIMMTRIDIIVYGPIHLGQDDLVVVDHGYDDVLVVSINEKVPQHGQHLCNDVLQGLQVEGIG